MLTNDLGLSAREPGASGTSLAISTWEHQRLLQRLFTDDGSSAENLDLAIDELYAKSVYDIVVEVRRVDYISSAGWGVFIARVNLMDENLGHFRFVGMHPAVQEVFEIVGLSFIPGIHTYESVDSAIEASQADLPQNK